MEKPRILVVEDDAEARRTVLDFLELEGYSIDAVSSTDEALEKLSGAFYPVVISDIYIDRHSGLDILKAARARDPECAVILMTGRGSMETVMAATRGGAFDYIAKPFELDRLLDAVKRAEASHLVQEEGPEEEEPIETEMVGSSPGMVELYKVISRVAPTDAGVLIEGETGTGKELVARMIHSNSPRAQGPFIPVDCAAIAPTLLESELFGSVRGAFTGADRDRVGVFEAANHGTAFLDEIGEVDPGFQPKLLRFLQEHEVRPLGSARSRAVDVRVIAATNRDLQKMVESGKFREDLWFRLNVVRLKIPPLRERRSDIPLLIRHYLTRYNEHYEHNLRLSEPALKALQEYTWPGNVRQLKHLIEKVVILTQSPVLDGEDARQALEELDPHERPVESLADAEAEQIRKVLAATGGNKSRAAQILGIERKTLYRKLERMNL
ncbi:MAG: sigma-54-dependent Fis family transcriptional regulator [Acidobacteria bacterium]|nr:sigma-54-dependent Fis family transcriptional regulator [Acidobacteriota bacterium]